MAGYSKVDRRVWSDEKFRSLSPPKPNAQTLWFFLITCPLQSSLPGIFSAGEATLAEFLGWPLSAFRRHWGEIERAGMGLADWRARFVWLRKGIHYDPPTSLNSAKAWGKAMRQLPECQLKARTEAYVDRFIEIHAPAFLNAYREAFAKTDGKSVANRDGNAYAKTDAKGYSGTGTVSATASVSATGTQPSPMPRPETAAVGAPGERGVSEPGEPPEGRDLWRNIRDRIEVEIDPKEFRTWFQPTRQLEFDGSENGGTLTVGVPAPAFAEWIAKRHRDGIHGAAAELGYPNLRVEFRTP